MYRQYVLIILMLTYLLSFMDRQILSILIEDIGTEFGLSDAQRGLLMGLAFALFYAGLGIPIAWLADRKSRKNIIAISVGVWSVATALCGAATGFWSLFAARVGVGIGEAGSGPPAHSLIADYFKRHEISRALSVHALGATLGGAVGFLGGGLIADHLHWRTAFIVFGIPGVVVSAIVYFTVREPRRGRFSVAEQKAGPISELGLWRSTASLFSNKVYVYCIIAASTIFFTIYTILSWITTIFIRNFDMSRTDIGIYMAAAVLFGAVPGMLVGGYAADKLGRKGLHRIAWLMALATFAALPLVVGAMMATTPLMMAICFSLGYFFTSVPFAPVIGLIQSTARADQRALASAYLGFLSNLVGLGAGPVVAGVLSDAFKDDFGARAINFAVAATQFALIPAALCFLLAGLKLRRDGTARAQSDHVAAELISATAS